MDNSSSPQARILECAVKSRCPRCGKGKLFDGFLKLAKRCDVCGLDYAFADPADGPAFFVMMTMAFPVTGLAIWIELAYDPPVWVHLVTSLPFLLVACILPLRFMKGGLIASQYINKAAEGRLAPAPDKTT